MQFPPRFDEAGQEQARRYDPRPPAHLAHLPVPVLRPTDEGAPYTPFIFGVPDKDEQLRPYPDGSPHQYPGHPVHEPEYRLQADGYRPREQQQSGMVLSNPVPDYSVASGSSPFTTQQSAPHFQPRPRPIMNPSQLGQPLLPHQTQRQHNQQQHQQLHQQHQDHLRGYVEPSRHSPYQPEWEGNYLPQGHPAQRDHRLGDLMPHPTQMAPLSNPHLSYGAPHLQQGPSHLQHHPHSMHHHEEYDLAPNGRVELEHEYQPSPPVNPRGPSPEEETDQNGKKTRKRRRLKGELPRDHALRKYKCNDCEQKFARPSALATHVVRPSAPTLNDTDRRLPAHAHEGEAVHLRDVPAWIRSHVESEKALPRPSEFALRRGDADLEQRHETSPVSTSPPAPMGMGGGPSEGPPVDDGGASWYGVDGTL